LLDQFVAPISGTFVILNVPVCDEKGEITNILIRIRIRNQFISTTKKRKAEELTH
jgi:hypothetical protein